MAREKKRARALDEFEQFYERQTGKNALRAQAPTRIKETLDGWGLTTADVHLEDHCDPAWNRRRNRTPLERQAVNVGGTNTTTGGYCVNKWWLIPKKNPRR